MEKARNIDYKSHYREKLEEGWQFQDYVAKLLYDMGMPILAFSSKKQQFEEGESKAGIEIKFDGRSVDTGNLWIETKEKAHPDNPIMVPSGIYRKDNTWLWIIGNYDAIYFLSKLQLQRVYESRRYKKRLNSYKTGQGFLYPIKDAEEDGNIIHTIRPQKKAA